MGVYSKTFKNLEREFVFQHVFLFFFMVLCHVWNKEMEQGEDDDTYKGTVANRKFVFKDTKHLFIQFENELDRKVKEDNQLNTWITASRKPKH